MKFSVALLIIIVSLTLSAVFVSAKCTEGDCIKGTGIFAYPNGGKYVGEFKNNYPDGFDYNVYAYYSMYSKESDVDTKYKPLLVWS